MNGGVFKTQAAPPYPIYYPTHTHMLYICTYCFYLQIEYIFNKETLP